MWVCRCPFRLTVGVMKLNVCSLAVRGPLESRMHKWSWYLTQSTTQLAVADRSARFLSTWIESFISSVIHCMCLADSSIARCHILLIIRFFCSALLRLLGSCMQHMKSVTSSFRLGIGSNPLGVCRANHQPHTTAAAAALQLQAALPRPFWRLLCQAAAGPQVRTATRPAVPQKSRPAKAAGPAGATSAAAADTAW